MHTEWNTLTSRESQLAGSTRLHSSLPCSYCFLIRTIQLTRPSRRGRELH
jgi:hypothetical protein